MGCMTSSQALAEPPSCGMSHGSNNTAPRPDYRYQPDLCVQMRPPPAPALTVVFSGAAYAADTPRTEDTMTIAPASTTHTMAPRDYYRNDGSVRTLPSSAAMERAGDYDCRNDGSARTLPSSAMELGDGEDVITTQMNEIDPMVGLVCV